MAQEDIKFGRKAVEMGWISSRQLQDCFKLQQEMWSRGTNVTLMECIRSQKLLNDQQIETIYQKCRMQEASSVPFQVTKPLRIQNKRRGKTKPLPNMKENVSKDSAIRIPHKNISKAENKEVVNSALKSLNEFSLPQKMSLNFMNNTPQKPEVNSNSQKIAEPPQKMSLDFITSNIQKPEVNSNSQKIAEPPQKMSLDFITSNIQKPEVNSNSQKIAEPPQKMSLDFMKEKHKQDILETSHQAEESPKKLEEQMNALDVTLDFSANEQNDIIKNSEKERKVLSVGDTFAHYQITDKLGQGGMGIVYKAIDTNLNRIVALKLLLIEDNQNKGQTDRFLQEAKAIAQFDHRNIIKIFDVRTSPQNYFSMEYVEGKTLDYFINNKAITPHRSAQVIRTIASAVHEMHKKKIIHRDIKPGNIIISTDGTPKLMDFGLVKIASTEKKITKRGSILGTPNYMAPEQFEQKKPDKRIDVYALGATLYEMLTFHKLFEGYSVVSIATEIFTTRPIPPKELRADIPDELEAICLKCLEKSPSKRYLNAQFLAKDLENFLNERPTTLSKSKISLNTKKIVKNKNFLFSLFIVILLIIFLISALGYKEEINLLKKNQEKVFETFLNLKDNQKIADASFLLMKKLHQDNRFIFYLNEKNTEKIMELCQLHDKEQIATIIKIVGSLAEKHSKSDAYLIKALLMKLSLDKNNEFKIKDDLAKLFNIKSNSEDKEKVQKIKSNVSEVLYNRQAELKDITNHYYRAIELNSKNFRAFFWRSIIFYEQTLWYGLTDITMENNIYNDNGIILELYKKSILDLKEALKNVNTVVDLKEEFVAELKKLHEKVLPENKKAYFENNLEIWDEAIAHLKINSPDTENEIINKINNSYKTTIDEQYK